MLAVRNEGLLMKTIACLVYVCLLLLTASFCQAAETAKPQFPLRKGDYWIYKGKIEWTPEGAGQKVRSTQLTWKMTVHDVIESAKRRVALVTGFPNDVAWYEEGMTPQYSLLAEDDRCVYWNGYKTEYEAMEAAKAVEADTGDGMSKLECIIEFPLTKGKKYGGPDKNRPDNMYAWYVDRVDKVTLKTRGYKTRTPVTRFRLIYRTLPDHIIMEFVPGLGLTRYLYEHHGTVAFEDLRLIEYGRKRP
jgi:hypothetical protein